jgi:hypothetical protein
MQSQTATPEATSSSEASTLYQRQMNELVFDGFENRWLMEAGERCALLGLTAIVKPKSVVEIGTFRGGSLSVFSRYAEKVYCLDIDPEVKVQLEPKYPGAEFLIGDSKETIPSLLARFDQDHSSPDIVLVDGDHTRAGVLRDIQPFLRVTPVKPMYLLMHDSFNPECRKGMQSVAWNDSPYFHSLDLDFVPGVLHSKGRWKGGMWGGLGLSIFLPSRRPAGQLGTIAESQRPMFDACYRRSVHSFRSRLLRLVTRMGR